MLCPPTAGGRRAREYKSWGENTRHQACFPTTCSGLTLATPKPFVRTEPGDLNLPTDPTSSHCHGDMRFQCECWRGQASTPWQGPACTPPPAPPTPGHTWPPGRRRRTSHRVCCTRRPHNLFQVSARGSLWRGVWEGLSPLIGRRGGESAPSLAWPPLPGLPPPRNPACFPGTCAARNSPVQPPLLPRFSAFVQLLIRVVRSHRVIR